MNLLYLAHHLPKLISHSLFILQLKRASNIAPALLQKWCVWRLSTIRTPPHVVPKNEIHNQIITKHLSYQNVKQFSTMPESLHVLSLFFLYVLAILKLTFIMKHPVSLRPRPVLLSRFPVGRRQQRNGTDAEQN